jgi:hypothetical protein
MQQWAKVCKRGAHFYPTMISDQISAITSYVVGRGEHL